jgi:hypothetical protein
MKALSHETMADTVNKYPNIESIYGFDDCIVGVCENGRGVIFLYSEKKIFEKLKKTMVKKEAVAAFDEIILSSGSGENSPVFLID